MAERAICQLVLISPDLYVLVTESKGHGLHKPDIPTSKVEILNEA